MQTLADFSKLFVPIIAAMVLAGCGALARAQIAQDAKMQMVGLNKEQVLRCMGPPANRTIEGGTEVWSFPSTNGHTQAVGLGSDTVVASKKFCVVNVVMNNATVTQLNFTGPNGDGKLAGEQCAYAVQNCVHKSP